MTKNSNLIGLFPNSFLNKQFYRNKTQHALFFLEKNIKESRMTTHCTSSLKSLRPYLVMGCIHNHELAFQKKHTVSLKRENPNLNFHQQHLHLKVQSLPLDSSLFKVNNRPSDQLVIARAVQSLALPFYKEPMPKESSYYNETAKSRVRLWSIGDVEYQSHLKKINQKDTPARDIHGSMHCSRVVLWTQVLSRFYEKLDQKTLDHTVLLAMAGAFHDVARETDGTDYWDVESSQVLESLLNRASIDKSIADKYVQTIKEKDPKNRQFSTNEQRIVHDADCLDIIRVIGKGSFKREFLSFYHFDSEKKALCGQLIDEVAHFIFLTEKFELRNFLEHQSDDFYGDLIRILFAIQEKNPQKFPLITNLIEDDMQEILKTPETETSKMALQLLGSNPLQLLFLKATKWF